MEETIETTSADPSAKKVNGTHLRLLTVIEVLSGHEVFGLRLIDIHSAVTQEGIKVSNSNVLRDLEAMAAKGWAQQLADGKWRLAAKPYQMLAHLNWGIQSATQKVGEVQHNYTRLQA